MSITVKELIIELLKEDMDYEVCIMTNDEGFYCMGDEQDINDVDGVRMPFSSNHVKSHVNVGRVFLALDKPVFFKE